VESGPFCLASGLPPIPFIGSGGHPHHVLW